MPACDGWEREREWVRGTDLECIRREKRVHRHRHIHVYIYRRIYYTTRSGNGGGTVTYCYGTRAYCMYTLRSINGARAGRGRTGGGGVVVRGPQADDRLTDKVKMRAARKTPIIISPLRPLPPVDSGFPFRVTHRGPDVCVCWAAQQPLFAAVSRPRALRTSIAHEPAGYIIIIIHTLRLHTHTHTCGASWHSGSVRQKIACIMFRGSEKKNEFLFGVLAVRSRFAMSRRPPESVWRKQT